MFVQIRYWELTLPSPVCADISQACGGTACEGSAAQRLPLRLKIKSEAEVSFRPSFVLLSSAAGDACVWPDLFSLRTSSLTLAASRIPDSRVSLVAVRLVAHILSCTRFPEAGCGS